MLRPVLFVLCGGLSSIVLSASQPRLVLSEDFESSRRGSLAEGLLNHRLIELSRQGGVDNSRGIRVSYVGYDRGSERVLLNYRLASSAEVMTLSYDVLFEDGFQFVRGGKLHGLGPDRRVTGGQDGHPEGWSARINFSGDGSLRSYIYAQDRPGRFGQSQVQRRIPMTTGTFYAVSMVLTMNTAPDRSDGSAVIYLDGEEVVRHANLRLRGSNARSAGITHLLFSTFHGGSNPDWAPRDADGNYTTVHAIFDNFAVYEGVSVRQEAGPCWR